MRVLIAEDDSQSQYMLATLLAGHGFEVAAVSDGVEALERLRREPFDLIMADLLMPRVDGFQLCRTVKADPSLAHIPFLVYTATYTSPEDEALARVSGADAFLVKPVEPSKILAAVQQVLQSRSKSFPNTPPTPSATPPAAEESSTSGLLHELDYLQRHNERLTAKLTHKLQQLQHANEDLSEREARFRALAEGAPVGILSLDSAGQPVFVNEQWTRLAGGARHWLDSVHPDDRPRAQALWDNVIRKGQEGRGEFRMGADGKPGAWVLVQVKPLGTLAPAPAQEERGQGKGGDSSAIQGFLVIVTDMTAEKQFQQEKADLSARLDLTQKLEALGTLVTGIAHEFNNLLTSILGYTDLARQVPALPGQARTDLDNVIAAAQAGRKLTCQVLTFARQQTEEFKPVNLTTVVRTAVQLVRPMVPPTVELRTSLPDRLPPVLAAETQVQQVVVNLAKNALDAMRSSGGVLEITLDGQAVDAQQAATHPDLTRGDYVVLTVRDTGMGIPPDLLSRIFDPFFTTKAIGEGTGLGLSVVHGIVDKHRGAITVGTEPGRGTTFRVFFPAAGKATSAAAVVREPITGSGQHILFIDDDPLHCRLAERMLVRIGYRVTAYSDPRAALTDLRRRPDEFDLVFTDNQMPTLSGVELANQVSQIRSNLPIVLVTGTVPSVTPPGVTGVLTKPFDTAQLSHAAARALRPGL